MEMVPDPRCSRAKKHDLVEMLIYLVAGYVTGHTSIRRSIEWAKRHVNWLRKSGLSLKNGIASPATISRLLTEIDHELFTYAFMEWIGEILSSKGRHIAIDGKAIRAAAEKVKGGKAPLFLNAIDAATGLVLAHLPIEDKDCEITKIPDLLNLLDIKGSVITTDAIGTQTAIMEQITGMGGHFVLTVKKNNPLAYEEVIQLFDELEAESKKIEGNRFYKPSDPGLMAGYDEYKTYEKNRDRHEYRDCKVSHATEHVSRTDEEWWFVKSVGHMDQTRILMVRDSNGEDITPGREEFMEKGTARQPAPTKGDSDKDSRGVVGIVSDMELGAREMAEYKRNHWSVENRLHFVLDYTFNEDRSPAKGSGRNLALIRKYAFNIIRLAKISLNSERPMTEIKDLFADDENLLKKYIFEGIERIC